jgi:hypothetical protein
MLTNSGSRTAGTANLGSAGSSKQDPKPGLFCYFRSLRRLTPGRVPFTTQFLNENPRLELIANNSKHGGRQISNRERMAVLLTRREPLPDPAARPSREGPLRRTIRRSVSNSNIHQFKNSAKSSRISAYAFSNSNKIEDSESRKRLLNPGSSACTAERLHILPSEAPRITSHELTSHSLFSPNRSRISTQIPPPIRPESATPN